jgi:hypothetical protein
VAATAASIRGTSPDAADSMSLPSMNDSFTVLDTDPVYFSDGELEAMCMQANEEQRTMLQNANGMTVEGENDSLDNERRHETESVRMTTNSADHRQSVSTTESPRDKIWKKCLMQQHSGNAIQNPLATSTPALQALNYGTSRPNTSPSTLAFDNGSPRYHRRARRRSESSYGMNTWKKRYAHHVLSPEHHLLGTAASKSRQNSSFSGTDNPEQGLNSQRQLFSSRDFPSPHEQRFDFYMGSSINASPLRPSLPTPPSPSTISDQSTRETSSPPRSVSENHKKPYCSNTNTQEKLAEAAHGSLVLPLSPKDENIVTAIPPPVEATTPSGKMTTPRQAMHASLTQEQALVIQEPDSSPKRPATGPYSYPESIPKKIVIVPQFDDHDDDDHHPMLTSYEPSNGEEVQRDAEPNKSSSIPSRATPTTGTLLDLYEAPVLAKEFSVALVEPVLPTVNSASETFHCLTPSQNEPPARNVLQTESMIASFHTFDLDKKPKRVASPDEPIASPRLKATARAPLLTVSVSSDLPEESISQAPTTVSKKSSDPFEWAYDIWRGKNLLLPKSAVRRDPSFTSPCKIETSENEVCIEDARVSPRSTPFLLPLETIVPSTTPGISTYPCPNAEAVYCSATPVKGEKAFANVLQGWKTVSNERPCTQFLSPENSVIFSQTKAGSAVLPCANLEHTRLDPKGNDTETLTYPASTQSHRSCNNISTPLSSTGKASILKLECRQGNGSSDPIVSRAITVTDDQNMQFHNEVGSILSPNLVSSAPSFWDKAIEANDPAQNAQDQIFDLAKTTSTLLLSLPGTTTSYSEKHSFKLKEGSTSGEALLNDQSENFGQPTDILESDLGSAVCKSLDLAYLKSATCDGSIPSKAIRKSRHSIDHSLMVVGNKARFKGKQEAFDDAVSVGESTISSMTSCTSRVGNIESRTRIRDKIRKVNAKKDLSSISPGAAKSRDTSSTQAAKIKEVYRKKRLVMRQSMGQLSEALPNRPMEPSLWSQSDFKMYAAELLDMLPSEISGACSTDDSRDIEPEEKELCNLSLQPFSTHTNLDHASTVNEGNATCNCSKSVFSGNDELIEFFLPRLGMACTCSKGLQSLNYPSEPESLANILRPWQVAYLGDFGIHRGDQLVKAHHRSADALASAMRQYRRDHGLTPFRTKSCGMALSIWAKTAKTYIRSVRKQTTAHGEVAWNLPNTLYILSSFLEKNPGNSGRLSSPIDQFEAESNDGSPSEFSCI